MKHILLIIFVAVVGIRLLNWADEYQFQSSTVSGTRAAATRESIRGQNSRQTVLAEATPRVGDAWSYASPVLRKAALEVAARSMPR